MHAAGKIFFVVVLLGLLRSLRERSDRLLVSASCPWTCPSCTRRDGMKEEGWKKAMKSIRGNIQKKVRKRVGYDWLAIARLAGLLR